MFLVQLSQWGSLIVCPLTDACRELWYFLQSSEWLQHCCQHSYFWKCGRLKFYLSNLLQEKDGGGGICRRLHIVNHNWLKPAHSLYTQLLFSRNRPMNTSISWFEPYVRFDSSWIVFVNEASFRNTISTLGVCIAVKYISSGNLQCSFSKLALN